MLRAILLVTRWIAAAHDRWRAEVARRRPLSAEIDVLHEKVRRLEEQNELLRARLHRVPLRRRPRYRRWERLLILIHRATSSAHRLDGGDSGRAAASHARTGSSRSIPRLRAQDVHRCRSSRVSSGAICVRCMTALSPQSMHGRTGQQPPSCSENSASDMCASLRPRRKRRHAAPPRRCGGRRPAGDRVARDSPRLDLR
jgi:hypothetical protein